MMDASEYYNSLDLGDISRDDAQMLRSSIEGYFNGTVKKPYFKTQSIHYEKAIPQYEKIVKSIGFRGNNPKDFTGRANPDYERKQLAERKITNFNELSDLYYKVYKTLPRVKR